MASEFRIIRTQRRGGRVWRVTYWRKEPRGWVENINEASTFSYLEATKITSGMMQFTGSITLDPVPEEAHG